MLLGWLPPSGNVAAGVSTLASLSTSITSCTTFPFTCYVPAKINSLWFSKQPSPLMSGFISVVKSGASASDWLDRKSQLSTLLVVCSWASSLTSSVSFLQWGQQKHLLHRTWQVGSAQYVGSCSKDGTSAWNTLLQASQPLGDLTHTYTHAHLS